MCFPAFVDKKWFLMFQSYFILFQYVISPYYIFLVWTPIFLLTIESNSNFKHVMFVTYISQKIIYSTLFCKQSKVLKTRKYSIFSNVTFKRLRLTLQ